MWTKLRHWAFLDPPHSFATELKPWGPGWRRATRFWGVLIILICTGHWLAGVWVFDYAGLWSADAVARLRPAEPAVETGIVAITAEEHRTLLSGTSPIPAVNLRQAVCALLRAKPKVLGIDLDTSHVEISLPHTVTKIVFARGIQVVRRIEVSGEEKISVSPDYLLGQSNPDVMNGLAVAPVMPDWSVRAVPTCYQYAEGRVMPTMIGILASAGGRPVPDCAGEKEGFEVGAYQINYRFDRFTLSDFAPEHLDKAALDRCQRGEGEWSAEANSNHPLKGKVVLLGGEYDSQDWHQTPYGLKPGVEVLAGLTEHVLRGSSAFELESWKEWGSKFVLAIVIAFIHSRFRPIAALLLCLGGLGGLVLAGGFVAAYFTAYRATMIPFLLGIVLEQLVTSAERAQEGSHAAGHGAAFVRAGVTGTGHS